MKDLRGPLPGFQPEADPPTAESPESAFLDNIQVFMLYLLI